MMRLVIGLLMTVVALGLAGRRPAGDLHVDPSGQPETHVSRILGKLGVRTRAAVGAEL